MIVKSCPGISDFCMVPYKFLHILFRDYDRNTADWETLKKENIFFSSWLIYHLDSCDLESSSALLDVGTRVSVRATGNSYLCWKTEPPLYRMKWKSHKGEWRFLEISCLVSLFQSAQIFLPLNCPVCLLPSLLPVWDRQSLTLCCGAANWAFI